MKITLLFFGVAHDLTGVRQLPLEIADHTDTDQLRNVLAERYAGLNSSLGYALAVNEVHCPHAQELRDGDVVAILPPVSGG
ncbi:MAG: MoaD/ThiS family protein [Flavobacteriales bacterium]